MFTLNMAVLARDVVGMHKLITLAQTIKEMEPLFTEHGTEPFFIKLAVLASDALVYGTTNFILGREVAPFLEAQDILASQLIKNLGDTTEGADLITALDALSQSRCQLTPDRVVSLSDELKMATRPPGIVLIDKEESTNISVDNTEASSTQVTAPTAPQDPNRPQTDLTLDLMGQMTHTVNKIKTTSSGMGYEGNKSARMIGEQVENCAFKCRGMLTKKRTGDAFLDYCEGLPAIKPYIKQGQDFVKGTTPYIWYSSVQDACNHKESFKVLASDIATILGILRIPVLEPLSQVGLIKDKNRNLHSLLFN